MTPVTSKETLRAHLKGTGGLLGWLVYWEGLSGVRIPRTAFRAALESMGLGDVLGRDPKAEACMSIAAKAVVGRQKKNATPAQIKLKDKGRFSTYAICMRRDQAGATQDRMRWIEEARVVIDRSQPSPKPTVVVEPGVPDDDSRDSLISDLLSEYQDTLDNIRTEEASEALSASMAHLNGLTLRPGAYFVPASAGATLAELREYMELHTRVLISCWEIGPSSANASTAARSARQKFLDDVAKLGDECREFADSRGEEMTTKSINARVKRFQELDGRVELYAGILGDLAVDLRTTIDATRKQFLAAIGLEDDAAA